MRSINIFNNQEMGGRYGNVKSHVSKLLDKYKDEDTVDIVVQFKNKYTQINYSHDDLPETLDDLFKEFSESVDLECCIFENGVSTGAIRYIKKFEDVKEEIEPKTEIIIPFQPNSVAQPKKESEPGQTVIIDVNQLFEKYSSSLQSVASQNNKPEPVRQENQNGDLVESLRQQIADLRQTHSAHIAELKDLLKEAKDEAKAANSQLFTMQIENAKLSVQVSQNVNPQTVEAKVEEAMRAFERNQKKLNEQTDAKKAELDALNLQVIEAKVKSQIKHYPDNSETDKAMADILRSKVPSLIDKGIDLFVMPKINGTNKAIESTTPII